MAIWNKDFFNPIPGVRRATDALSVVPAPQMAYWGQISSLPGATPLTHPQFFSYAGLVENADGRCNAWAELLLAVMLTQGVPGMSFAALIPVPPATYVGFRVKSALAGQANAAPVNEFDGHAAVKFTIGGGTIVLDPSYGKSFGDDRGPLANGPVVRTAEVVWEDESVSHLLDANGNWVINPGGAANKNIFFAASPFTYTP